MLKAKLGSCDVKNMRFPPPQQAVVHGNTPNTVVEAPDPLTSPSGPPLASMTAVYLDGPVPAASTCESSPRAYRLPLKSPSGCPGMTTPGPDEDVPVHEQDTFLANGNVGWRRSRFQTCPYNPMK